MRPHDDVAMNIMNERRGPPDPNPTIPCAECGEKQPFKDYWEPRYVEPDDIDPHESEWLCDDCKTIQRRKAENHRLTDVSA